MEQIKLPMTLVFFKNKYVSLTINIIIIMKTRNVLFDRDSPFNSVSLVVSLVKSRGISCLSLQVSKRKEMRNNSLSQSLMGFKLYSSGMIMMRTTKKGGGSGGVLFHHTFVIII